MASLDWIDVPHRFVPADEALFVVGYRSTDWQIAAPARSDISRITGLGWRHRQPSHRRSTRAIGKRRRTTFRCWQRSRYEVCTMSP